MAAKKKAKKEAEPEQVETTQTDSEQVETTTNTEPKDMTEQEQQQMMDMPPPDGLAKGPRVIEEEKPEAPPAQPETKPEAPTQPAVQPTKEDFFEKLEREIQKPEGKEDLSQFTPREKAYFHQMRRDRKLRQQAEADRDAALFRESKSKTDTGQPQQDAFLGDRDPDDFITVSEAREAHSKMPATQQPQQQPQIDPRYVRYLKMCEKEAKEQFEDFDVVAELSDELIANNKDNLIELERRVKQGENPAIASYEIIKADKEFEALRPAAEIRAKQRAAAKEAVNSGSAEPTATATPAAQQANHETTQAENALEQNAAQPKTTAHVPSRETAIPSDELTLEQIHSMKDSEFAKLPRHVRQKYLQKYGA